MWHRMMRMRKRAVHFPKLNRRSGSVTIFSRSMRRLDSCVRASMYSIRHLVQPLDGFLLRLLLRSGDAVQRCLLCLTGDVMETAADGLDLLQRVGDRLGGLPQFEGQVLLLPRRLLHRPSHRQQVTVPAAFLRQLLSSFAGLLGFGVERHILAGFCFGFHFFKVRCHRGILLSPRTLSLYHAI